MSTISEVSDLIIEVFRLNGRLLAAGDRLVGKLGLTSARWQVLGAVAGGPEAGMTVPGVARAMGLTRQAVQRLTNEMRGDGLLVAQPNPAHRRAPLLALSEAGAEAFAQASRRQAPWAESIAEGLESSSILQTTAVLRALRDRLDRQLNEEAD